MEVKCGSQPFLVLHHFIMSNILLQNIVLFQLPQKNDEMIAKCPRVPWECGSFFKPSYKWMGFGNQTVWFHVFFHTQKKQRKIQQIQRPVSSKQVLATLAQTCNSCPRTRYQQVTNVRPVDVGRDA